MEKRTKNIWLTMLVTVGTFVILSLIALLTIIYNPWPSIILNSCLIITGVFFTATKFNKILGWGFIIGGITAFGAFWIIYYVLMDLLEDLSRILS